MLEIFVNFFEILLRKIFLLVAFFSTLARRKKFFFLARKFRPAGNIFLAENFSAAGKFFFAGPEKFSGENFFGAEKNFPPGKFFFSPEKFFSGGKYFPGGKFFGAGKFFFSGPEKISGGNFFPSGSVSEILAGARFRVRIGTQESSILEPPERLSGVEKMGPRSKKWVRRPKIGKIFENFVIFWPKSAEIVFFAPPGDKKKLQKHLEMSKPRVPNP